MSLSGQPGNIKLAVRDESGPEGTSMLQPDSMDLVLKTGPSRKLAVEGPVAAECATRAVLPQLKVRVADMAGNFTNEGDFEVRKLDCSLRVNSTFYSNSQFLYLNTLCACNLLTATAVPLFRWRQHIAVNMAHANRTKFVMAYGPTKTSCL